jgi:adenosylcobyric acid synthase
LHGIFDEPAFREALIALLRERKGTVAMDKDAGIVRAAGEELLSARQMQERQLNILANVLREHLDWKLIYEAIGI